VLGPETYHGGCAGANLAVRGREGCYFCYICYAGGFMFNSAELNMIDVLRGRSWVKKEKIEAVRAFACPA